MTKVARRIGVSRFLDCARNDRWGVWNDEWGAALPFDRLRVSGTGMTDGTPTLTLPHEGGGDV